jgi:hypothetical protein
MGAAGAGANKVASSPVWREDKVAVARSGSPEEGADVIAVDVCQDIESVPYSLATSAELQHTVNGSKSTKDRLIVATPAERDYEQIKRRSTPG